MNDESYTTYISYQKFNLQASKALLLSYQWTYFKQFAWKKRL